MRALKVAVLLGAGILVGAMASISAAANSPSQATATALCSLPGMGTYSPGAIVLWPAGGQRYRCFYVYGPDMKATTVGWIKMRQELVVDDSSWGR